VTGSTHIAVGIASSLAIMQPKSVPDCLCAITGGMIGGMICDIDSPGKRDSMDIRDDQYGWQLVVYFVLIIGFLMFLDYLSGNGAVAFIVDNAGPLLFASVAIFVGLCIYGTRTSHRTFMHSLLAGALMSASVWFFCQPVAIPFAIGFASHLLIDFLNKKKVQYLWPLKLRFGLNRFPSDGKLNATMGAVATVISFFLGVYFFLYGFAGNPLFNKIYRFFSSPFTIQGIITVPMLVPYLIIVNIVTIIAYTLDYHLYMRGAGFYTGDDKEDNPIAEFIMTLLLILDMAGGFIGKLLVVLFTQKGKFRKIQIAANFNLYIVPICIMFSWIILLLTFFIPQYASWVRPISSLSVFSIPVKYIALGYMVVINTVTLLVFPRIERFGVLITPREKVSLLLWFFGGASGGYISMKHTGNHEKAIIFSESFMFMIPMHAIFLACVLFH